MHPKRLLMHYKSAFEKVFIARFCRCELKNHATIWANNNLAILAFPTDIFQVPATSHRLHSREHYHHCFRANALPLRIHRATISAFIFIANLLAIPAIPLCFLAPQESHHFDFKLVFLVIPFFHRKPYITYLILQKSFIASTLSVFSQLNSLSSRPKCPYAAVLR